MTPNNEVTLRFLAAPTDVGYSGNVDAGRVLEWIDKAGYALAVGWCGKSSVTAFVGNINFTSPIRSGALVEVKARIVHTGRSSMHMKVRVDALDQRTGVSTPTTSCLMVFVATDEEGRSTPVPTWQPVTPQEVEDEASAVRRISLRAEIETAMAAQTYTDDGTAPSVTLRFLSAPTDVNWGGKVHGGYVMRWIDEAAHVIASRWTGSTRNVAVYSGGIRFYRPMHIGDLVEVEARLLHTGTKSMHISVHVRSGNPAGGEMALTTHGLTLFVQLDEDGNAVSCPKWVPVSDEDRALDSHAVELVRLRAEVDNR